MQCIWAFLIEIKDYCIWQSIYVKRQTKDRFIFGNVRYHQGKNHYRESVTATCKKLYKSHKNKERSDIR